MTPFEQFLIPAASLLFLGIAFLLIVATTRTKARPGAVPLANWGGPWPTISGLTICGCMGMGRFLGVLLAA